MEEEDPSWARVKRIAVYLRDAIDAPVHDVATHKRAMIDLLQFLTIEEAYSVSLRYRKVYEWFQTEGVWRTLAQRWLTPQRYNQVWQWAERARPEGGYINYLWLLIAEYAASGRGYLAVYYEYGKLGLLFGHTGNLTYHNITNDFHQYLLQDHPERRTEYGRFRLVYRVFVDYPDARCSFEVDEGYYDNSPFRDPGPDPRVLIREQVSTY